MLSRNDTTALQAGTGRPGAGARVDWVDYAKGICIVMVVMMHSTLGVEAAAGREGFMHALVAFARPFRMPDFFLISGLFLGLVIDAPWRRYLDRKVVHFAYFYVLWVTIQFLFKAPQFAHEAGWAGVARMYLEAFIEPFGTLWFIYLLPIFFTVTRLSRPLPVMLVWAVAAALEMLHVDTGWTVIDEFAARFVYFYSGYLFAAQIFALSRRVEQEPARAGAVLLAWALANGAAVAAGISTWPLVSLALGFAGAVAIIAIATLLAAFGRWSWLRYCGEHSLIIYLAFFLPMATTRTVLLRLLPGADIGLVSLAVTTAGVLGALVLWCVLRRTALNVLFERPDAFRIAPKGRNSVLQAAE